MIRINLEFQKYAFTATGRYLPGLRKVSAESSHLLSTRPQICFEAGIFLVLKASTLSSLMAQALFCRYHSTCQAFCLHPSHIWQG